MWHLILYLYRYDVRQVPVQCENNKTTAVKKSLKQLPVPQSQKRRSRKAPLTIDHRVAKKDFSSVVTLLKRKYNRGAEVPMPADIKPMMATLTDKAFNHAAWQFEIKLDGYRALAYLKDGKAELRSRNNNSFKKFAPLHTALSDWNINAVIDGEIVVLNEDGHSDFSGIQQWEKKGEGQLLFYVFDLLWLDGMDLMQHPLHERQTVLRQLIPDSGVIRFSDHIDECGLDFFEIAKQNKLEGIIAKDKNAPYIAGIRSKSWLKIKTEERHEAVICGYTRKPDSDRLFSSLILGVFENRKLKCIGQVGTGFDAALQKKIFDLMQPLIVKKAPVAAPPTLTDVPVWIRPRLVCEVRYQELTREGVMRHASFQGLRDDKGVEDVNNQAPQPVAEIIEDQEEGKLLASGEESATVIIDEKELRLTNLKKVYWPVEKIDKGDLLNYYNQVAPFIMPYMLNRPQSLNRFPNGINGESFYQKNMSGKVDKWVKTFNRVSENSGEAKDFMICTNTASLIYMANLGCIEMNPWHSRVQLPHYPDWSVIDLDPGEIEFEKVIETARMVRQVLDHLAVPSFPKTSGSTGIHIYVPLGAKYNYEQSRQFAELIAHMVHETLPAFTSIERNPAKRKDKIYIDFLQNRPIQTICAPYSVRPKPGATVSTPLHWDEVRKGLRMEQFTMRNIFERLKTEGDLFEGVLQKGMDLHQALKALTSLI